MCKADKTLRGPTKFEVRLLQQAAKIEQKSMKNACFGGIGRVLKDQKSWFFSIFFLRKMEAKNKNVAKKRPRAKNSAMNAPRAKNSENKVRRWQFPVDGWPPLKACYYSMLMQVFNASSLKAHWSNTPGHCQQCGGFFDFWTPPKDQRSS